MEEKQLPNDADAEFALLGTLLSFGANPDILEKITPKDFFWQNNQLVYESMLTLYNSTGNIDIISLNDQLRQDGVFDKIGGDYTNKLLNCVSQNSDVANYINIVKEKSLKRQLITTARSILSQSFSDEIPLEEAILNAEKSLSLLMMSNNKEGFSSAKDILQTTFEQIQKVAQSKDGMLGEPCGFSDLDRLLSGLQKSDLIIVAARPSMGKTAFSTNIATKVALSNKSVGYISLEMSKVQLMQRIISSISRVPMEHLKNGRLTEDEWALLSENAHKLEKLNLHIDDNVSATISELKSKVKRLKAEHGLDLLVIDYLQLMQGNGSKREENRQQEVSAISRALKQLARELDIPIIALSQLSRSVEQRQSKKPILSDLRESGSIEQDADVVIFLYREDYYDEETEQQNITDVIVAKQRNGALGSVKLYFHKDYSLFTGWQPPTV